MGDWKAYGLFCATALYCQTLGVMGPFLPLIAADKHVPEWMVGLIFATCPLASLLASPFVGSWLYRLGRRNTLSASFLLDVSGSLGSGNGSIGCSAVAKCRGLPFP